MVNAESYLGLVYKIATRMWQGTPALQRWGTCEDACQEAILILYRAAGEEAFDATRGKFSTYLYLRIRTELPRRAMHGGIIRSAACSHLQPKYQEAFKRSISVERLTYGNERPDTRGVEAGLKADVHRAIDRLRPCDAALARAVFIDGEEQQAVALRQGRSQQAVGQALKRIKATLAKALVAYA